MKKKSCGLVPSSELLPRIQNMNGLHSPRTKFRVELMKQKMKDKVKKWMEKKWGKHCPDYARGCALCKAWKCYDYLFKLEE